MLLHQTSLSVEAFQPWPLTACPLAMLSSRFSLMSSLYCLPVWCLHAGAAWVSSLPSQFLSVLPHSPLPPSRTLSRIPGLGFQLPTGHRSSDVFWDFKPSMQQAECIIFLPRPVLSHWPCFRGSPKLEAPSSHIHKFNLAHFHNMTSFEKFC